MDLEILASVIGAPTRPKFEVDWKGLAEVMGTRLPADYRAFVEAYGPAAVGEFLWPIVPLHGKYFRELAEIHRQHAMDRDEEPSRHPYAFYPEPDGLIPWGTTRRSDHFFWGHQQQR